MNEEKTVAERIEELQKAMENLEGLQGDQKEVIERVQEFIQSGVLKQEDYRIVAPTSVRGQELASSHLVRPK